MLNAADAARKRFDFAISPGPLGNEYCAVTLAKLALISFMVCFHLLHEPDEFGRLSDAVEIRITLEQGIGGESLGGSLSQPFNGLITLAPQRIEASDVVGRVMVGEVLGIFLGQG